MINHIAKKTLGAVLRRLPLVVFERIIHRDVIVFCYHAIADHPLPHVRHLMPHKTPAEFEADVLYLKSHYHLPTWQDFIHDRAGRGKGTRPCALITFDDGLAECFHFVRPILRKHQIPCIFFISKAFVDNQVMFYRHKVSLCLERIASSSDDAVVDLLLKVSEESGLGQVSLDCFRAWMKTLKLADEATINRVCALLGVNIAAELEHRPPYMTSAQIKQLAEEGFTLGGHTVRHEHLHLLTNAEIEQEIVESCAFVSKVVGADKIPFAFPFGLGDVDRHTLLSVADRYPSIPVMFGTNGIIEDLPFIINRIWSDMPIAVRSGRSGLKDVIRRSYVDSCVSSLRQWAFRMRMTSLTAW